VAMGRQRRRASPAPAEPRSRLHEASPTSRHAALALLKATQLITYRAQVQRFPAFFFFLFLQFSKPKAFCTPQASTSTLFTAINATNRSGPAPRAVPGSRASRHGQAVTGCPGQAGEEPGNPASPGSGTGQGIASHLPATQWARTTPTAGPRPFNRICNS